MFLAGVPGEPYRVGYSRLRADGEIAAFHDGLVAYACADLWAQDGETAFAQTAWQEYLAMEAALWKWVQDREKIPLMTGAGWGAS